MISEGMPQKASADLEAFMMTLPSPTKLQWAQLQRLQEECQHFIVENALWCRMIGLLIETLLGEDAEEVDEVLSCAV